MISRLNNRFLIAIVLAFAFSILVVSNTVPSAHAISVPTLATVIRNSANAAVTSITVGAAVHDTATITPPTGVTTPITGTVTYTLFSFAALPSATTPCSGGTTVGTLQTVTIGTGNVIPNATAVTPSPAGFYGYSASYSGDTNYSPVTSNCEPLTVIKASVTSLTTAVTSPITVGSSTTVSATLVGGFPSIGVTGTVTYTRFAGTGCTGTGTSVATVTIGSGDSVPTASNTPPSAGSFSYQASYSGDSNNNAFTGTCANVTVDKTNITSLTTTVTSPITIGSSTTVSATLVGGFPSTGVTGTVTYTKFAGAGCTGTGTTLATVAIGASNAVSSATDTPSTAGSYSYQASYSGDTNNNALAGTCANLTVNKASITSLTTAVISPITVGSSTTVSATLVGGFPSTGVTGTVTYTRFTGTGCTTGTTVATVNIGSANAVPSATDTPPSAGSYSYQTSYSGDANNNAFTGTCASLTVNKASITSLVTAVNPSSITVGQPTTVSAALTGGFPSTGVTGTVTYTRFSGTGCTGTGTTVASVSIGTGNLVPTSTDSPSVPGGYSYQASYAGDINNNAFTGTCANLTVSPKPGLICITTSTTATSCSTSPPTIGPLTVGSTFTVGVFVNGSAAMGGFDIYVAANPAYLTPTFAALGNLIASPSLTSICINGSAQNGTCTVGTANGLGVVEVSTIESSGTNECGGVAPCSGLAFTITYKVVGSTPTALLFYPTAPGCSTSSVSSPLNTCVLVDTAIGATLPENVQGASVTVVAVVCITSPSTATPCTTGPVSVPITLGSTFTVGVRVENSQPLAGFDIYVGSDPTFLTPTNASLGSLIASPSLTTRCVNGQSFEGACTVGTANGPGVVEVSTIESSGVNECSVAPCSGLAFTITYRVVGATPSAFLFFPSALGCSTSSVSSPMNVCVLVLNATGIRLPENIQGAIITQNISTGHSTSLAATCGSPIVVGVPTTCTATITDTSSGAIPSLGIVVWSTDGSGAFAPNNACTLSATGPNTSTCSVEYVASQVGTGGAAGTGISHIGANYSGDTVHLGSTASFALNILRSTPIVASFPIIDQTGLPIPSTGVPQGVPFHDALLMIGGYPVTGAPGTVTYTLFPNNACTTGTGTVVSTVNVGSSDNVPSSAPVAPVAGSYSLDAFYLAGANNYNVTSACTVFTVTSAPSLGHIHWTHHLSLSRSANTQSWTVGVSNPLSTSAKVVVRIVGGSTINPSLNFDVTCGVTCVNTLGGVNITPGLTPVTVAAGASASFSFSQPLSASFVSQKVSFTMTLYWTSGTLYTSDGSSSGSFAVSP